MASVMPAIVRRGGGVSLERVAAPEPRDGELRVEVRLAGICRTDLFVADGALAVAEGRVLGHELVGGLDDGARVTVVPALPCGGCDGCAARPERCARATFLGVGADGGFARWLRVPAACARAVPDAMSDAEAAFVEPFAAALAVLPSVPEGARVGVIGENRIAALVRRVIACATGAETVDVGEGALDVVIETVPTGAALDRALGALRPGGLLVLKSRPVESVAIDVGRIVQKEIRIVGARYAPFEEAIAWIAERRVAIDDLLGPALPLARFADAFALARRAEAPKVFLEVAA